MAQKGFCTGVRRPAHLIERSGTGGGGTPGCGQLAPLTKLRVTAPNLWSHPPREVPFSPHRLWYFCGSWLPRIPGSQGRMWYGLLRIPGPSLRTDGSTQRDAADSHAMGAKPSWTGPLWWKERTDRHEGEPTAAAGEPRLVTATVASIQNSYRDRWISTLRDPHGVRPAR